MVYTFNWLTGIVNRKTSGEVTTSHKYTLDAAGHRIKIEEQGSVVEYGYDKLNRLTSEKRNGVVTLDDGYTYDPVGNRVTKASLGGNASHTYDENDRLKSDGKYNYGWDENGNLTSRTGPDRTSTYKYDPENRLIEVSGQNGTVQFAYDAQGNRISRTTASGTTTFVVDPNMPYAQVLEENGPAGAKVYAYGNDMLNMQGPEGTRWFAYDGLGSTRALTDGSGTLTDTYTYEAFGTVVRRTGTSANDFQFTGEQYEAALDMYYLRARYYEPGTGRFGARDSYDGSPRYPSTAHKYLYANANPITGTDPSGKMTITYTGLLITGAVIGTLASIAVYHFGSPRRTVWGYLAAAVTGAVIGYATAEAGLFAIASFLMSVPFGIQLAYAHPETFGWMFEAVGLSALEAGEASAVDSSIEASSEVAAKEQGTLNIAKARRSAVGKAWRQERRLVKRTGKGTVDWSEEEIQELLRTGRVESYYGHHINSVQGCIETGRTELIGDPNNIEFLTSPQHYDAHLGNWQTRTTGELLNRAPWLGN